MQVGTTLLLDASADEQQCASCVVAVAVDRHGACCGLEYLQHGLLDAAELSACIKVYTVTFLLPCIVCFYCCNW